MAGIDGAVRLMAARGGELLETLENNYAGLVSEINNELKYISAYPFYKGINDAGKLLLSASDGNNIFMTGTELSEILRNEYGAETEMSSERYVLAMFTVSDDREAYKRLFDALTKIDETLRKKAESGCTGTVITEYDDIPRPKIALPPGSAWKTESEEIPVEESVGRISGEIVGLYPPGTPLLAMGELIEREHVKLIKRYIGEKLGVSGIKDGMISVLKGEGLLKDI
jgi:arginine/lysine/ornithine decarboxylase